MSKIRVTIWNEFRHEKNLEAVKKLYPQGMHKAIADGIAADDLEIRLVSMDEPQNGLPPEILEQTDVLMWWGHCHHQDVADEVVKRVHQRVLEGMGLIVLHSGHKSKIFMAVTGTSCSLKWREVAEKERVWTVEPSHPIAAGVGEHFEIPNSEMYGERFDIPQDGEIIFMSWYEGGEVFRSGVTFNRGHGKVFYFSPGHETYPIYYQDKVLQILSNAVRWAKPTYWGKTDCPNAKPLEIIESKELDLSALPSRLK